MALLLASSGATSQAEEEWEFSIAPLFLWGMSINGEATVNGNTAPLDLDFKDDVLENLEAVFTLHFEARRGDWVYFAEYQYADLQPSVGGSAGPVDLGVDIGFEDTMWEFGAGRTFSEDATTRWELLFGGRHMDHALDLKINTNLPLPPGVPSELEGGDDWWHGFGGLRVSHAMTDNWTFIGRADYGYGGSDNSAVNLAALFDYRFRDWGSAFLGYRYMDFDYDSSSYGFDANKQGPLAGLNFYW